MLLPALQNIVHTIDTFPARTVPQSKTWAFTWKRIVGSRCCNCVPMAELSRLVTKHIARRIQQSFQKRGSPGV